MWCTLCVVEKENVAGRRCYPGNGESCGVTITHHDVMSGFFTESGKLIYT